jgi:Uma2 family endonuclease
MTPIPQEREYTYADLLAWDDGVRYELYGGRPVALASPSDVHQEISGEIYFQIRNFLSGKPCKIYYAPFDVRLFEENGERPENVDTVVQPDLMVVCDPGKVDRRGVHGAPDLVIEILSDSTRRNDRLVKYNLYQKAGVREYWIVDPDSRVVSVYTLEEGAYHAAATYAADAQVPVGLWEDFSVDLTRVFPET